jgi:hypothetical protein
VLIANWMRSLFIPYINVHTFISFPLFSFTNFPALSLVRPVIIPPAHHFLTLHYRNNTGECCSVLTVTGKQKWGMWDILHNNAFSASIPDPNPAWTPANVHTALYTTTIFHTMCYQSLLSVYMYTQTDVPK